MAGFISTFRDLLVFSLWLDRRAIILNVPLALEGKGQYLHRTWDLKYGHT